MYAIRSYYDTIPDQPVDNLVNNLDSLIHKWYLKNDIKDLVQDSVIINDSIAKLALNDSVYIQRLADIESPIKYTFNSKVKSYIELYTIKRREQVQSMLGLSEYRITSYNVCYTKLLRVRNNYSVHIFHNFKVSKTLEV